VSPHLYAVPDPDAWPPVELEEIGERILTAAGYLCSAGDYSRQVLGQAAADIVTAACRAEVLIRDRVPVQVEGQLPLDADADKPWGEKDLRRGGVPGGAPRKRRTPF
jgi:hypothetical protein